MVADHGFLFPASFSQQRLWFLDRLEPGHAFYNMPAALRIPARVGFVALQRSLNGLVRRHESLRTSFLEIDGQPFQMVAAAADVTLRLVDLMGIPAESRGKEAERVTRSESARPFALSTPPLVRAVLLRLDEGDHVLLLTIHHIVADGWSLEVLFRELGTLYEAYGAGKAPLLPPLRLQYADFALWQRAGPGGQDRDRELRYWRHHLAGLPEVLALPVDRPRPAAQRFQGGVVPIELSGPLVATLRGLAQAHDATPFMVLLAGFQALLHRYTGVQDLAVGSPVAGRHHEGLESLVGLFVNTLVLRAAFDGEPTVRDLLARVRQSALGAFVHQDLPFEQLVAELAPRRALAHQPLVQILFGLQSVAGTKNGNGAAGSRRAPIDTGTAKCDLTLSLTETEDSIAGFLEYDTDLFDRGTVEHLRGHFAVLLAGMAEAGRPISALPLLTAEERRQLVDGWNETATRFPSALAVHQLVEAQARRTPRALAVCGGSTRLTYAELDRRADRLASALAAQGVRRGDRVGVCLERSPAMVTAWLGILKAGAAYVPLDPDYPRERLAFMVADSGARMVVADRRTRGCLPTGLAEVLDIGAAPPAGHAPGAPGGSSGDDLAYVVYTSGSTGTPKGVAVPHRAINRLVVNTNYVEIVPSDRVAQASSASFDAATFEVWGALVHGARLVVVPREAMLDPAALARRLRRGHISVLFLTTSLFHQIAAEAPRTFRSLRCLLVGGEMADPNRFRDVLRQGRPARLLNVYGPTETTTFATFFLVEEVPATAAAVPIGWPIANTRAYVVDERLELVPAGVPGELALAGEGLATGYLNRPELTAEKFVPEPFAGPGQAGGGRMYRTGDLVRRRADGALEVLGRLDDQVKIRGFRVEPGEVEAVLGRHPAVRQAAVMAREIAGEKRLVAYVAADGEVAEAALREFLRERLPEHLVPAAVVCLPRLPLTANGKVDRAALPAPRLRGTAEAGGAPRTPAEAALAAIWAEVLGREAVGVHDNFFELGGDSIRSIQMIARATRAGLRFTPKQVFQHQTIAELAPLAGQAAVIAAEQGTVAGDVPLTPIQRWFFEQDLADPHHFNQAVLTEVAFDTGTEALETAARHLLRHHDALRLRYERTADGWRQWIAPPDGRSVVTRHDLTGLAPGEQMDAMERLAAEQQRSLDLARGPIFRVARFDLDPARPAPLLMVAHHLAVDVVSWSILAEDLAAALRQAAAGRPVELPRKTTSFKTWAERLACRRAAMDVREELAERSADPEDAAAPLPTDFPCPPDANTVGTTESVTVALEAGETAALLHGASRTRAQTPDLLLAALLLALAEWTGRRAFVVDVEGHGRDALGDEVDVSRTVGWFTTISPVPLRLAARSDADADADAAMAIASVREAMRQRAHPAAPGEAQIAFNYLGRFAPGEDRSSAASADSERDLYGPTRSPRGRRRHLFEIDGGVVRGRLTLHWTYSRAAHRRATVEGLARAFGEALRRVAACLGEGADRAGADFPLAALSAPELELVRQACPSPEDVYPLSPLQEGMLFHSLYAPGSGQYVVQMWTPLAGGLDVERFRQAWRLAVHAHPILRTAFAWEGVSRPLQVVHRDAEPAWDLQDWRTLAPDRIDAQFEEYLARERTRGFRLDRPPLLRFGLVRVADDAWRFLWCCHHLLLDGWSRPLVLEEVAAAYEALGRGESPAFEPRPPFRDYIRWLGEQDLAAAERFWRRTLSGFPAATAIVPALPRSARPDAAAGGFDSERRWLAAEVTERLEAAARRHQLTLGTIVHGAWALLLGRYTGSRDVVFGLTVAGRPAELAGVERMVGPFINTLPARVRIAPGEPAMRWLRDLQQHLVEVRQLEYSPLAEVQRWSEVPPGTPLFETLVVFENYPSTPGGAGSAGESVTRFVDWTNYPLTFTALPGARLALEIVYRSDIAGWAVHGMLDHLRVLLTALAGRPESPLAELPWMTGEERHRLVVEWNDTRSAPPAKTVPQLVAESAARSPDAVAAVCGAGRLTYQDLQVQAQALAARLRAAGLGPGTRVGVYLERSLQVPVALLGILHAGAAYVLLDPAYPPERIAFVAGDARLCAAVTTGPLAARLPPGVSPLLLDSQGEAGAPVVLDAGLDDPAYVVYTSGSTGEPKGVAVPHRALANHAVDIAARYGLRPRDRVLQLASLSFDVAAEEIFPTWIAGGAVVLWPDRLAPSIPELLRFADEHRLTVLNLPTPLWHEWVDELDRGAGGIPPSVRRVVVGTSRVDAEKLARWRALAAESVSWCNAYGCTETTITSTVYEPGGGPGESSVPIGRPIANTRAYVVDERLELVPAGVPGELVLAGEGVATGYLHRPELTAEKFVPEPFAGPGRTAGGRAYRTGDLVRYRADGALEILGRLDDQVKIRGFRVEPGEVEAVLGRHPAVGQAAVVAREIGGEQRLVAYVVADAEVPDEEAAEAALRRFLRERLPEPLVPAAVVRLPRLPMTANGKLDRDALPAPRPRGTADAGGAPRTPAETALAAIWVEVLGLAAVGVHDNFFELGGHSLIATRMISRIRRAMGVELPLRALFDAPTIAALAERLERLEPAPAAREIPRRPGSGPCPLSFAQERLWFLDQLAPGTTLYNMPSSLHLAGRIDPAALEASLNEIVRRHEALRTTFAVIDGRPAQLVAPELRLPLRVIPLTGGSREERRREAVRRGDAEIRQPFDLQRGPLVRATLLRLGEAEHVLLVTMHHIVADGWSVGVLLGELETLYAAFSRGRPSPLPELPVQYGDYAVWQREWLAGEVLRRQVDYWRGQLAGAPPALDLPADRPRPPAQTFRGSCQTLRLPPELMDALRAAMEAQGVTLFMVVLTAFQLLLSRLSGQEDVCVGTPIAGRSRAETEPLIGFFLNNLVLRTDLSGDPTFRELLGRVREVALGAFAHQDLPFERLLAELDPPRDPSRTPLFQVFLNVLNLAEERLRVPGAVAESFLLADTPSAGARETAGEDGSADSDEPAEPDMGSQFDLTLYAGERDGTLRFVLVYNVDLFDASRMAALLDQLESLLAQCLARPDQPISGHSLVTRGARRVLPDPREPLDGAWMGAVHDLFAAHARRAPGRVAVSGPDETWTYAELDARSSQLAHRLRETGVVRGDVVAIWAARSPGLVWAILGVLKSGAAFTILDPGYPPARLLAALRAARARVIVQVGPAGELPPQLAELAACRVILPPLAAARREGFLAGYPALGPETGVGSNSLGPDDLACVGFTSGSTGVPKGILGRHGPLTHFLPWLAETFALGPDDRFSMLSGLSHDPLQREVFTPLCLGATLCVPAAADFEGGASLAAWAARERVSVAHLTPALGQLLAQAADRPEEAVRIETLRRAFFVGDALYERDVARLRRVAPRFTCVNYYGTTETQRAVGYFVVPPAEPEGGSTARREPQTVPAGRGIRDVQLLVLNGAGGLCGIGELGEIHVRSPHLAAGYLGDPELTAEKFLANPFTGDAADRLYRSGDMGRYLPDGNVAFAGRRDLQVKIRGFRIELSEIESVIAACEQVRDVVVVAREDRPGDRRLVAYVVAKNGGLSSATLRDLASERLPGYMVPAHFVLLDALPVTPNGKVDRRALPAPRGTTGGQGTAPRTPLESEVAGLWQELLALGAVDVHQGFFEAGGHSLLATELLARVRSGFGVEVSLARFFARPTVAGLAEAIEEARQAGAAAARRPIEPAPRAEYRIELGPEVRPIVPPSLRDKLLSAMRGGNGR